MRDLRPSAPTAVRREPRGGTAPALGATPPGRRPGRLPSAGKCRGKWVPTTWSAGGHAIGRQATRRCAQIARTCVRSASALRCDCVGSAHRGERRRPVGVTTMCRSALQVLGLEGLTLPLADCSQGSVAVCPRRRRARGGPGFAAAAEWFSRRWAPSSAPSLASLSAPLRCPLRCALCPAPWACAVGRPPLRWRSAAAGRLGWTQVDSGQFSARLRCFQSFDRSAAASLLITPPCSLSLCGAWLCWAPGPSCGSWRLFRLRPLAALSARSAQSLGTLTIGSASARQRAGSFGALRR